MLQLQTKTGCAPKTQFTLDRRHLKMVSVIMTRGAPHWRRKVGQQEVSSRRPSHFSTVSIFSSSVPNMPHKSQKHCGYPTLKEALDQNSRLSMTQLRSLTVNGNRKRRPSQASFCRKSLNCVFYCCHNFIES